MVAFVFSIQRKKFLLILLFALLIRTLSFGATLYSYQSGNWTNADSWTTDPGGTTLVGSQVPANGDIIVILDGRTMVLTANVASTGLDITLNSGGVLDLALFTFSNSLAALRGQGTLQLSTNGFPGAITNTFVNNGGGTTEYKNTSGFILPVTQSTYNNLTINANGIIATQKHDISLNGSLYVKKGTYRINDNAAARYKLVINGNVIVDNGATIMVGTGVTNTTTDPLGIEAGTAPFIDYYDAQSHRIVISGDFINNGTVRFTNLVYPVYNAFPPVTVGATTGFATVYFRGATDNILTCNGTTDFYNLVLDKGSDQTFSLTIYSSLYPNFRLFGANTSGGDGGDNNPNLKKALWIRTGTLILKGLTIIPSLSEGTCNTGTGGPNSDFYIPANAALVLDGSEVVVLSTADDYREVNVAYGLSGGTGLVNGVNRGGCSSYSIYGKIQINDGYFSTRESGGFITWDVASGQFIINGGVVDAKQFRAAGSSGGLASYTQTGGLFILRGRFQRTPLQYTTINDLTNVSTATLNTARANEGTLDGSVGTFNINSMANVFTMSDGTIRIYDVCRAATPNYALQINSSTANINVTGGTVELIPTAGSVSANADFPISTTAPIGGLTIARASGTSVIQLTNYPLTVLENLTLAAGALTSNNLNVTVGGNFLLNAGTTYTPGSNTTRFENTGNNIFTLNGLITGGFANLAIDKSSGSLALSRTVPTSYTVSGTFDLLSGSMNDGGNTLNIAGNITNSGIHTGAGAIVLNGTTAQTIGGDGDGIFQNLTLNNTTGASAYPVSTTADITVNGVLRLQNNKIFNISSYKLSLGATATLGGTFGAACFIATNGDAGDKGISKTFSSNSFAFPIGVIPTAIRYTPTTLTLNSNPTTYGIIAIHPVDAEQMQTSANGKNRSLTYFWRVRSSGFVLGTALVSQTFKYVDLGTAGDDVVTGGNVTENGYVPARFNPATNVWFKGGTANVNEGTDFINWPNNVNYIDGDYTAGDDNPIAQDPFQAITVFYSSGAGTGAWNNRPSWVTDTITMVNSANSFPDQNTPAIIRNGHTITIDANGRASGNLKIQAAGVLICGTFTGLNFGVVSNPMSGSGTIRISSAAATAIFPSGDFTDFLNTAGGTVEYYTTGTRSFIIPLTSASGDLLSTYRNLVLTPANGYNITMPNRNLTVFGNMSTQDAGNSYLNTGGTARTLTINGNLNILSGNLYLNNASSQTLIVLENITLNGTFRPITTAGTHNLTLSGSLYNNGTLNFRPGTGICNITFSGAINASLTGTGNTTLNNVTLNKGNSQSVTLTVDVSGATFNTLTNAWLTLTNGTLKFMRTGNLNVSTDVFTIPSTAGLHTEHAGAIVNIAQGNGNGNDLYLNGKLTLVSGAVNIGSVANATNNDIEYSGAGFSEIEVNGGNLVVNGQIRRNPATTDGILGYTQSGGNVTINGQSAITTNAKLEILNTGSVFNMSNNAVLTLVRGGGGNTNGDLFIRPEFSSVTGGTIILSQGTLNEAHTYRLDATVPLNNLTITGKTTVTARNANVNLMVNPLILNGNLLLSNVNSILTSNNINVTIKGDLTNNGAITSYVYGTNTTTFSGVNQTINGSSPTNFYNLVFAPSNTLTLTSAITVNRDLMLTQGTFSSGTFDVNVKRHLLNNATHTGDDVLGGIILNSNAEVQHISGTGVFGRLKLDNINFGARILNDITLQKNLVLANGIFNINQYLITLGQTSIIEGAPFGITKMITPDGVFSNIGIRKFFGTGASNFTFPLGVSGKYTPALLTIDNNATAGSIRVNTINDHHPAVYDPDNVLQYYWEVESSGISGFEGSLVLKYDDADVMGTESQYIAARLVVPGTSWSKATDNVDETNDLITFNYTTGTSNLSGEYTAGLNAAIPDNVPTYTSNKDGNWTEKTNWDKLSPTDPDCPDGGPNGFIVIINHHITANSNFCSAYRTTINEMLDIVYPFVGHNFGTVNGAGTLRLESGNLPAGRFTQFLDCTSGGTLEYAGIARSYTIIADRIDQVRRLLFTGTGTRTLQNKDLTVCELLRIDGPTVDHSASSQNLFILGAMERINGGAYISGTNSTVSFSGTLVQVLGSFSGTNAINHFEINNGAGLTLNSAVDIKGNLILTRGNITTTEANILKITNTSINCIVPLGGSAASYVDGPLTKQIIQGDNFLYPIGKGPVAGNKLTLSVPQTGTLNWTAEFHTPGKNTANLMAPITTVSSQGWWSVDAPNGNMAKIGINWDPQSDLSPLMTQNGISDMRVARFNGTNWIEVASAYSGDDYNGTATSTAKESFVVTNNHYTLGCINPVKPRASIDNSSPVCEGGNIPVLFTSGFTPYSITYTVNGGAPVTETTHPSYISATVAGTYVLTEFRYGTAPGLLGVVDITVFSVDAQPTIANAGVDQTGSSMCGLTSISLAANAPSVGTGMWSIVTGTGGTIAAPSNPLSNFSGTSGNTYVLRWTITNGTCISSDNTTITFQANPTALVNTSDVSICEGTEITFTANTGMTNYEFKIGINSVQNGASNTYTTTGIANGNIISVVVTNAGGCSATSNTIAMTVDPVPVPTITGTFPACENTIEIYTTETGKTNYVWSYNGAIVDAGGTATDNTITLNWDVVSGISDSNVITVNYEENGCMALLPTTLNVEVYKKPETGPAYFIPNNF